METSEKRLAEWKGTPGKRAGAFTLIELLTVIAIIGVLAGLLIPLSGVATAKMRMARVNAELNNLVSMIEQYKSRLGSYPPDHGMLSRTSTNDPLWRVRLQRNPLFYELSGAVFTNVNGQNVFRTLGTYETVTPQGLDAYFGLKGVQNSARSASDVPYRSGSFKEAQYRELKPMIPGEHVDLLVVPVPGPLMLQAEDGGGFNTWFYDSSTTNRNNRQTYDLWAEIKIGNEVHVVGNWQQP